MHTSGIIRRVDSLGRVVIPKEIRQNMGIRTGDSLEISMADNRITLVKHSWLKELELPAKDLVRTLLRNCGRPAVVADRECILAAAGFGETKLSGVRVSSQLYRVMESRSIYHAGRGRTVSITDGLRDYSVMMSVPIIVQGEAGGCVLLAYQKELPTQSEIETNEKILTTLTSVIGSYLSE